MCWPAGAVVGRPAGLLVRRMAGAITSAPHSVTWTSTSPAARAAAAICAAVMAALARMPNSRSWVRPASTSAGVSGQRCTAMSEVVSTPPGRSTRTHSAKNSARDRKWNAASTLMIPSTDPLATGSRAASPATGAAAASRSRSRPAASCHSVMFTASSRAGRTCPAITGSWVPSPFPASRITPPVGNAAGHRLHQAAAGRLGLVFGARALPQAEVEPAGGDGQEEVGADALVDPGDRVAALAQDGGGMPYLLARPPG